MTKKQHTNLSPEVIALFEDFEAELSGEQTRQGDEAFSELVGTLERALKLAKKIRKKARGQ